MYSICFFYEHALNVAISSTPLCYGEVITIPAVNYPGFSYQWAISAPSLTIFAGYENTPNLKIQNINPEYSGPIYLTLQMSSPDCGTSRLFQYTIWLGKPFAPHLEKDAAMGPTYTSDFPTWEICTETTSSFFATDLSYPYALSYFWEVSGGTIFSGQGTDDIIVNFNPASSGGFVKVTASNNCGSRTTIHHWNRHCGSGVRLAAVSPNPASSHLTISILDGVAIPADGFKISLQNKMGENFITDTYIPNANKQIQLNVSLLKPDIYILHIQNAETTQTEKIVIE